jgi:hypothetical protein
MPHQKVTKLARFDVNPADPHVQRFGPHLHLITLVDRCYASHEQSAIDPTTVREGDYPSPQLTATLERRVVISGPRSMFWQLARLTQAAADTWKPTVVARDGGGPIHVEPVFSSGDIPQQVALLAEPRGSLIFRGSPECLRDLAQNIAFATTTRGHLHLGADLGSVASLASNSLELIFEPTDAE